MVRDLALRIAGGHEYCPQRHKPAPKPNNWGYGGRAPEYSWDRFQKSKRIEMNNPLNSVKKKACLFSIYIYAKLSFVSRKSPTENCRASSLKVWTLLPRALDTSGAADHKKDKEGMPEHLFFVIYKNTRVKGAYSCCLNLVFNTCNALFNSDRGFNCFN